MLIITNNPLVKDINGVEIDYFDVSYLDVLTIVKEKLINNHYTLLSHPLSGSIKPNENYFKSILLDSFSNSEIDMSSLDYIDSAIDVYHKFIKNAQLKQWTDKVMHDFSTVDYFLIKSALESANIK